VVGVERRARAREVGRRRVARLAPRQRQHPVEEGARDPRLGRHGRHAPQPAQLAQRPLLGRGGEPLRPHPRLELVGVVRVAEVLAQLLVDDLELLRQPELALPARDRRPHPLVDRPLEPVQLDLAREHGGRARDQPVERGLLQQLLPRRQRPAHVRHHPPRPPLRRGRLAHRRHQLRGSRFPPAA
jgi:hypothetical protein